MPRLMELAGADLSASYGFPDLAKKSGSLNIASKQGEDSFGVVGKDEFTPEEKARLEYLKKRDAEVRQHEQAHLAAAGSLAIGGIKYDYETGPDGKQYAVGGHVSLDTSPAKTPEETIEKAQQIQRAALAPAEPSPQDVKIAAKAAQMLLEAQRELSEEDEGSVSFDQPNAKKIDIYQEVQGDIDFSSGFLVQA